MKEKKEISKKRTQKMTDNKLKDFAVRILSKYVSNDEVDTFINQGSVKTSKIKDEAFNRSVSYESVSYEFRLENDPNDPDSNKKSNLFVITATKRKRHDHSFSTEKSIDTHTLEINSDQLFTEFSHVGTKKSSDKKNADNQKIVKKEIKEFLKNFRKHHVWTRKINKCWTTNVGK